MGIGNSLEQPQHAELKSAARWIEVWGCSQRLTPEQIQQVNGRSSILRLTDEDGYSDFVLDEDLPNYLKQYDEENFTPSTTPFDKVNWEVG
ncbi:hypothetical protein [Eupransor demetentiae]|uniref:Uncharacterized protein n=1 Tax=Eupransor demetentiae TaxID=3109584 RepID=A0ABP0ESJ4_9LACO|nr:hypothetical protein R54876_GBNLAHCA_00712 [Lactobacillaceae bacterium LMG 33000]